MSALADSILSGDPRSVARGISLVENDADAGPALVRELFARSGHGFLVGVTGAPGAGKSTLVDGLVSRWRKSGSTVGVLAVDPTSPFTGGAMLGDRVRMQAHAKDAGVFIRSMATRGHLGGLARATTDAATVLDAAGHDLIAIETVGVGQDEVEIARMADVSIVVLVPGMGDDVQALKAGVMEIADIFVVNKADRDGAARMKSELELMLQLRPAAGWTVPVLLTVASDGKGIDELVAQVDAHHAYLAASGEGARRQAAGRRTDFARALRDEIDRRIARALTDGACAAVVDAVEQGSLDPYAAMRRVLADPGFAGVVLGESSGGNGPP